LLRAGGNIVSLHLSSKMSGTWQSAMLAKKELGSDRIQVVDALSTSIGLGNLVAVCARAAHAGRSAADILGLATHMIATHRLLFVVDTLEYLRKGGRIGLAAAFIGGLLNIKPILSLRDGQVCLLERCRGSKNVQNRFIELVNEYLVQHSGKKICTAVTYAGDSANLDAMLRAMSQHLDTSHALRTEIGAVVGAHVGPGCYGISLHCLPD
ncbi:MAG TPA: DegV family protein, partial [Candidatus Ozemobacteraceae bacterium]|nr:DegV family protein [Candidatus Ozemobacteraceae bacterium]